MIKTGLIFALVGLSGALWLQNRELQSRLAQSPAPAPATSATPPAPVPATTPVAPPPCTVSAPSALAPAKKKIQERLNKLRERKEKMRSLMSPGQRQNQLEQKLRELYQLRLEFSRTSGLPAPDPDDLNPDRSLQKKRIREIQEDLSKLKPPQRGLPHPDPEKGRIRAGLLQELKSLEQENHLWNEWSSMKPKKNGAPVAQELRSKIQSLLGEIRVLQNPPSEQQLRQLEAEEQKWELELRN